MKRLRPHISLRTTALTLVIGGLLMTMLLRHLTYNATPSAPVGWYWYTPLVPEAPIARGQLVRITIPLWVREELHRVAPHVDADLPWMKTVVAGPGDTVCLQGENVTINGTWRGTRPLLHDYPLTPRSDCGPLAQERYFVMSGHPRSFDSRYVGAFPRAFLDGTFTPLWTWEEK